MALPKILKRTAIIAGSLVIFIVAVLVIVLAIGISINVDGIRARAEEAAAKALGRKVSIEGHLSVDLSLRPALEIEGLKIANSSSWESENFISMNLFRAQVRILPLLRSRIHIQEITADGIDVDLELKADGQKNWLFDVSSENDQGSPPPADSSESFKIDLIEVEEFSLSRLVVSFRNHESDQSYDFKLNSMKGSAVADEPLKIDIDGAFQKQRYYMSISGDPVGELFKPTQSWHLEASAEMVGITLNVSGQADKPLEGKGFDILVKLDGERFGNLAEIFGVQLPPLGAFQLAARMQETETGYSLSKLNGNLGQTAINGKLEVNLSEDKPRIQAELILPAVDAGPLQAIAGRESKSSENQEVATIKEPLPDLSKVDISLDMLNEVEADIELKVEQVLNVPGDIRDASLKVNIHDGALVAPMAVAFADVTFQGNLNFKNFDGIPGFLLNLGAEQTDLGNLALVFTNTEGIEGHLASFNLSLGARGENLQSLIDNLDMQLRLDDGALSYGNVADGRPVGFTLKKTQVDLLHDQNMSVVADGTLLDVPFILKASGGSLNQFIRGESWPIDLSANGGGAAVRIKGAIAEPDDPAGSNIALNVSGKRIGGLAAWVGVSPKAKLPYALKGTLNFTEQQWEIKSLSAHLGKTTLKGRLGWKPSKTNPLLTAKLRLENVEPAELASIVAADQSAKNESEKEGFTFDMPIMSQKIELEDADIDIGVNRIHLQAFDVTGFSLTSRIRDGQVKNSPFQATVSKVQLNGRLSLDLRGTVPEFMFKIDSTRVDIGLLLAELNVAKGLDAVVAGFGLDLHIKGSNLRTILSRSEFRARLKNGKWILKDPNTGGSLEIQILKCDVVASAGQPVVWNIEGRIKEEPVKIQIKGSPLAGLAEEKVNLPLSILAEAAGVKLELSTAVDLPIEKQEVEFAMLLSGDRLNSINSFAEVDLPPYGPYELGGRFLLKKTGYYLNDLKIRVNQSHMTGKMSLETQAQPPLLDIDLTTPILQINDFKTGDWSPLESSAGADQPDAASKTSAPKDSGEPEVPSILSPEFMRKLDARLDLKVQEVLSGEDKLGSGNLVAGLEKGRFFVDPLQLNIPGGSVNMAFAYEPTEKDAALEARANIEQLDFGILARRVKPESNMGGWLSLDIDLKSRADSLDTIMHHANGTIDFAVVPENLEANLFELWAVNLLTSVLPQLDSEATSKVNCAVFRFDIKDGIMTSDAIFTDTTKMQVGGEAKVNFKTEEVYLVMAPKAKKAEFFSLATPIEVKGTFTDYKIGVRPGGLIGTAVRFITSPVVVPIQRVFTEKVAADGKAACSDAMHRK
ncbi:MAG: AsmA family protein [bacterium]|nr:AsmA family protein [bacterium]